MLIPNAIQRRCTEVKAVIPQWDQFQSGRKAESRKAIQEVLRNGGLRYTDLKIAPGVAKGGYTAARSLIQRGHLSMVRKAWDANVQGDVYYWDRKGREAGGVAPEFTPTDRTILERQFWAMLGPDARHAAWKRQAVVIFKEQGHDNSKEVQELNRIWQLIK